MQWPLGLAPRTATTCGAGSGVAPRLEGGPDPRGLPAAQTLPPCQQLGAAGSTTGCCPAWLCCAVPRTLPPHLSGQQAVLLALGEVEARGAALRLSRAALQQHRLHVQPAALCAGRQGGGGARVADWQGSQGGSTAPRGGQSSGPCSSHTRRGVRPHLCRSARAPRTWPPPAWPGRPGAAAVRCPPAPRLAPRFAARCRPPTGPRTGGRGRAVEQLPKGRARPAARCCERCGCAAALARAATEAA